MDLEYKISGLSTTDSKAFIGVSLDSSLFSRLWIRYALKFMLDKHRSVMFLLADDLLRYTRTARMNSRIVSLDFIAVSRIIRHRCNRIEELLMSEIQLLTDSERKRVSVKHWGDFSDNLYTGLLRNLHIAYTTILPFQNSIHDLAQQHSLLLAEKIELDSSIIDQLCSLFLLDEIAMCLRVTELDDYDYEYYPHSEIAVLTELYADKFASHGLSIENMLGKISKRRFQMLEVIKQDTL